MECHPNRSDIYLFSINSGQIGYSDLRISSSENYGIEFQNKSKIKSDQFNGILNSVSKAKFAPNSENYIFSRDYLSVKIWDIRSNRKPIQVLNVTEYLDQKLQDVYENKLINDKFDLSVSPSSKHILTGSYHSHAHVIDINGNAPNNTTIDVDFMAKRGIKVGIPRSYKKEILKGTIPLPQNNTSTNSSEDESTD